MSRSKSGLFLMELIIVITFFAVAGAVCMQLFAAAHRLSTRSIGMQMAVISAQSAAESFKAAGGDMDLMASLLGGTFEGDLLVLGFDENWVPASADIRFEMVVETDTAVIPAVAIISVSDRLLDEELYKLTVKSYLGAAWLRLFVVV